MEKVNFTKLYTAAVRCPACRKMQELGLQHRAYREGRVIKCKHCGYTFLLGKEK